MIKRQNGPSVWLREPGMYVGIVNKAFGRKIFCDNMSTLSGKVAFWMHHRGVEKGKGNFGK